MWDAEFGGSKSLFRSANPLVRLRLHSRDGIEFFAQTSVEARLLLLS